MVIGVHVVNQLIVLCLESVQTGQQGNKETHDNKKVRFYSSVSQRICSMLDPIPSYVHSSIVANDFSHIQ